MSLTGRSPSRSASTMRRRVGSARVSKASSCTTAYIHEDAYLVEGRAARTPRSCPRPRSAQDRRMRHLASAFVLLAAACGPKVHMDPMPMDQDDPSAGAPVADAAHADADRGSIDIRLSPPAKVAPPGAGARTGTIARASLVAVLDAGPGAFLHGFEVAPLMDGDKFAGWRLVQMMQGEHRFDGLDLVPGDVLLAVNG